MWFIGLEFHRGPGGLNLTLTYEIQIFINSGAIILWQYNMYFLVYFFFVLNVNG